jgi:hypothetical protein
MSIADQNPIIEQGEQEHLPLIRLLGWYPEVKSSNMC